MRLHYWFNIYVDFAGWVELAYWWSFIGGGSANKGDIPSSIFCMFYTESMIIKILYSNTALLNLNPPNSPQASL